MTLLQTTALSRHFGGIVANNAIDFTLQEGDIHALIGPNGAGKSTFVSLLCGRLSPTAGRIRLGKQDITRLPPWRRIQLGMAYTFQINSIYGNLSCYQNVELATRRYLSWQRINQNQAPQHIIEALSAVGLAEHAEQQASQISYGHQRLLEVAMGLALHPKLLMLDEPTQGLSEAEAEHFVALIRRLSATSTILLIEHNMRVVMALADTITVLHEGAILASGTPVEIRDNAQVQSVYLGHQSPQENPA